MFQNCSCLIDTETLAFLKQQTWPCREEDMSVTSGQLPNEKRIAREIERILVQRLPAGWSIETRRNAAQAGEELLDLLVEVTPSSGETARFAVGIERSVEPRAAKPTAEKILTLAASAKSGAIPVVAAGYLSARTRKLLDDCGVGYVDTTGNVRLVSSTPGLAVLTQGAYNDPWPQAVDLQTLRGRGAARAVRAIVDTAPPFGIRELADATSASAATLSRVVGLLEREAIVTRQPRGPVAEVNWQAAIRRWAEDYGQTSSNTPTAFLDPRGLPSFEKKLKSSKIAYAATGAIAAQQFNPVAPARIAAVYVDDASEAADGLGLRETDAGANVVLLEPLDPVVFERATTRGGLRCVAASQLAADLLTGPEREPSQGEEMLEWMQENEIAWRT